MQVGIVAPVKYLHLCLTSFHLCYATLLFNKAYLNFYRSRENPVLLDSSPRLPRRPNLDTLLEGVKLIKPAMIILPSVDYSSSRTISLVKDFLRLCRFKQLVGVLQGLDLDTLRDCYQFLKDCSSIIGLPSPLETIARRDEIVRDLGIKEKVLYIEIYRNPYEEIPPSNSIGICTSLPVRLAIDYRKLSEYNPTPPPLDFHKDSMVEELAKTNIEEYLEVIRYAGSEGQHMGFPR